MANQICREQERLNIFPPHELKFSQMSGKATLYLLTALTAYQQRQVHYLLKLEQFQECKFVTVEFGLHATPKTANGNTLVGRQQELLAEQFILRVLLVTHTTANTLFFPEIFSLLCPLHFSSASLYYH